jgi:predicted ribosomally synthesized peptide with nif11-like leader
MTIALSRPLHDFLQALEKDEASRDKLKAALEAAGDPTQVVIDFAAAQGFAVTAEDIAAVQALADKGDAEQPLSDDALDQVGGGVIISLTFLILTLCKVRI